MSHIIKIKKKKLLFKNSWKDINDELKLNFTIDNKNNFSKYDNFKLDNDYKFNLAAKLFEKNLKDDTIQIYKELYCNDYNKFNIGIWLIQNDSSFYIKNIFQELIHLNENNENNLWLLKKEFYTRCLFNPHKYDLSINELDNYQKDFTILLSNKDFLKIHKIDFFAFSIFSNIHKLHYIKYLIPEEEVKKHRKDVFHIKNETKKIAFLCIPIEKSPIFYVYIEIFYHLSKLNPSIIIFLDNKEEDLNEYSKLLLKNCTVYFVKDLNDDELYDKIKLENIDILISNYGHFQRMNILLKKPCKILIRGLDGECFFPDYFVDYNLSNKINLKFTKIIKLNNYMPIMKKINYKLIFSKPIFNKSKIKIGLITTGMKLSKELITVIKNILQKNNVLLTIYSFGTKEYLQKILDIYDENKLIITTYNNSTNEELKSNLFYLDTFLFNNHSTALEILSAYRPIISYSNKHHYFGSVSYTMIKNINMTKELSASNPQSYYNLVMKYINSKELYNKMFEKFCICIKKSKILDNKYYTKEFYKKIDGIDL
jgi:hypothetical protein